MKRSIYILSALLALLCAPSGNHGAYALQSPQVEVKVSTDRTKVGGKVYYLHAVQEGQTLYSIGRAYGVSSLDIMDCNPKLGLDKRLIRPGDVLLIPWKPVEELPVSKADTVAVPSADSEAVASVSVAEDSLVVDGAVEGLQVPGAGYYFQTDSLPVVLSRDDSIVSQGRLNFHKLDRVKVALLLPFDADTTANPRYLNFYFGALLAARELGAQGINVDLTVLDTKSAEDMSRCGSAVRESDVVIGPVGVSDISECVGYLPEGKYMVSPIDPRTEVLAQSQPVIIAPTPATCQIDDAIEWMRSETGPTDSLIIVREDGRRLSDNAAYMLDALSRDSLSNRSTEIVYALSDGVSIGELFSAHTHADTVARVVALSEHDVFTGDVVRNVALQNHLKKKAVIYGSAKTKSADIEEMCGASLRQSVTYYIDYDSPEVISFVNDWRALVGNEPDNFAFHGYDTMMYFALACSVYGSDWAECLDGFQMRGLQISFDFRRLSDDGGYVNTAVRRIMYTSPYTVTLMY